MKKPSARTLNKNKSSRSPQYFCFADTETTPTQVSENKSLQVFRLGVAIFLRMRKDGHSDNRNVLRFTDINEFWQKLDTFCKGKNTIHIVAHNALFDMTVLQFQTKLSELGYKCSFIFDEGMTFISKWQLGQKRIMILDNSNWFVGALQKWGDVLGKKKMPMPEFEAPDDEWFPYCERDAQILEELQLWLIAFIKDNDLGNWKYTLASQSFNAYRHRFMHHPIYIPDKTRETYLARTSYRGGRTECLWQGLNEDGPFYKLDVNSMYPYVMSENNFPTCVEGIVGNCSTKQLANVLIDHSAIARVDLNVNIPFYPVKVNKKTCYPLGSFTTVLSTPELKIALNNDWITKVHEVSIYRHRKIFTEFIEYFYQSRLEWRSKGDEMRSTMFKLFMNSLYGKFGQRGFNDTVIGNAPLHTVPTSYYLDSVTGSRGMVRQIGTNVIRSEKGGESYNSFVAIASHVTSYARCYLFSLVLNSGYENTFYMDTDSLIVNEIGYNRLRRFLDMDRIGSLKLEGIADSIDITSPKHYGFGEQWKIKGISRGSVKIGENEYRQEIWPGFNTLQKEDGEYYYNYTINKVLSARVSSGLVEDVGHTKPFTLIKGELAL